MAGDDVGTVVYAVRHTLAMSRSDWPGPDSERPLTAEGFRQSEAIADRLALSGPIGLAMSSPALRCRQTIAPTALRAGLEPAECDELMEGGDPLDALELLLDEASRASDGAAIAACTHGDVIDGILETFGPSGVDIEGPLKAPKAATWRLVIAGGRLRSARFVAPPG